MIARRGPLASSYAGAVAFVICRLVPFLLLTGLATGGSTLFILGAERLQAPDLESWTQGEPAWESTPLFSRLRGKKDGTSRDRVV